MQLLRVIWADQGRSDVEEFPECLRGAIFRWGVFITIWLWCSSFERFNVEKMIPLMPVVECLLLVCQPNLHMIRYGETMDWRC